MTNEEAEALEVSLRTLPERIAEGFARVFTSSTSAPGSFDTVNPAVRAVADKAQGGEGEQQPDLYGATQGLAGALGQVFPVFGQIASVMGTVRNIASAVQNIQNVWQQIHEPDEDNIRERREIDKQGRKNLDEAMGLPDLEEGRESVDLMEALPGGSFEDIELPDPTDRPLRERRERDKQGRKNLDAAMGIPDPDETLESMEEGIPKPPTDAEVRQQKKQMYLDAFKRHGYGPEGAPEEATPELPVDDAAARMAAEPSPGEAGPLHLKAIEEGQARDFPVVDEADVLPTAPSPIIADETAEDVLPQPPAAFEPVQPAQPALSLKERLAKSPPSEGDRETEQLRQEEDQSWLMDSMRDVFAPLPSEPIPEDEPIPAFDVSRESLAEQRERERAADLANDRARLGWGASKPLTDEISEEEEKALPPMSDFTTEEEEEPALTPRGARTQLAGEPVYTQPKVGDPFMGRRKTQFADEEAEALPDGSSVDQPALGWGGEGKDESEEMGMVPWHASGGGGREGGGEGSESPDLQMPEMPVTDDGMMEVVSVLGEAAKALLQAAQELKESGPATAGGTAAGATGAVSEVSEVGKQFAGTAQAMAGVGGDKGSSGTGTAADDEQRNQACSVLIKLAMAAV